MVKNPPASAGDTGLIPGSGRSSGEGSGNPLQYSCLGNLMDQGAWQTTVYSVAKSQTQLKLLSTHIACGYTTRIVYPLISHWAFALFPPLAIINNAAMSICVHTFGFTYVLISLGYETRSIISGSYNYF